MKVKEDQQQLALWLGITGGVVLGIAAIMVITRMNDAPHRMSRLLKRCEDRIHNIERSLTELQSTLRPVSSSDF